jgi:predicted PurR-regulated permease PerM
MESLIILLFVGIAMALFCIPVMAIYTFLEENDKKKEIRRYVRRQIMKQMEREKKQ